LNITDNLPDAAIHTLLLPGLYVEDRDGRDLSVGTATKVGNRYRVVCDNATLLDMKSDADYQAFGVDQSEPSIVRSAARAHTIITAYIAGHRETIA
jgi:hypothetical protein